MDKYFSPTYDPLLDFTPAQLSLSNSHSTDPNESLIGEGSFDSWDKMLNVMKERKEEKRLRELRDKEERRKDRERKRRERRRKRGESVSSSSSSESEKGDGKGMMGIKYEKQGATREWDRGKETPT